MNTRPYQVIGEKLRHELASGAYSVGDRMPPERDIAEKMGVSRATVRDAMIMLELEGLVEVRKGSGTYVIAIPADNTLASATTLTYRGADTGVARDMGVFEMLQARQVLESHIAELAATQLTKHDVLRLQRALDTERSAIAGGEDNEESDRAFHIAIAEATQNGALVDIVNRLWVQRQASPSWMVLHNRLTDLNYREKWLVQHQAIFNALKKKDSQGAKQAMWEHLESVKQTLLELSDIDDPTFDGFLFDSYSIISN